MTAKPAIYSEHFVDCLNEITSKDENLIVFGENIDVGSKLGGLAKGLNQPRAGVIRNVPNCELSHVGLGMGIMLDGGSALLLVKQLDFLLLALDQAANTHNLIRASKHTAQIGNFKIVAVVCDQGYQGPQSSLNNGSDLSSLLNIPVYCLNSFEDTTKLIRSDFRRPGFEIFLLSQKKIDKNYSSHPVIAFSEDGSEFLYRSGYDVTILCLNFSLSNGIQLADEMASQGKSCEVLHANYVPTSSSLMLFESVIKTRKLVILDDSKSVIKFGHMLVAKLLCAAIKFDVMDLSRPTLKDVDYGVTSDHYIIDSDATMTFIDKPGIQNL
jgi:pyruvate/2-oxoglutarate/acetoin dehydrogenase E1 component